MVVSLEQHCCLADLGIRLRTLLGGIVASDGVASTDGDNGDIDGPVGETLGSESVDIPISILGGLPEPVHRAYNGP